MKRDIYGNHFCKSEDCIFKLGDVVTFDNSLEDDYAPVTKLLANYGEYQYIHDIEADCGGFNDHFAGNPKRAKQIHLATREEVDKWNEEELKEIQLRYNYDTKEMEYLNGIKTHDEWEEFVCKI